MRGGLLDSGKKVSLLGFPWLVCGNGDGGQRME